jgi:hypothetical protein
MKTKFGVKAIKLETPNWAKWVFRTVFILSTAATFLISNDPNISSAFKISAGVWLQTIEFVIFGLSKMCGIPLEDETK